MYVYEIILRNKISGCMIEMCDVAVNIYSGIFHTKGYLKLKKHKRRMDTLEIRRVYKKASRKAGTRVVSDILYKEE